MSKTPSNAAGAPQYPDVYGAGALFAFSGTEGKTDYINDLVATLLPQPVSLRIETKTSWRLRLPVGQNVAFKLVCGDAVHAFCERGEIFVSFLNGGTIVGFSPVRPVWERGEPLPPDNNLPLPDYEPVFSVTEQSDGSFAFSVCAPQSGAISAERTADFEALRKERYAFYDRLPYEKCEEKYRKLFAKACSVLKLNVLSPEGLNPLRWTTPDRVPHRDMWLWDSAFHALALKELDPALAQEALLSVLERQREDGFIPVRMSPYRAEERTQPPVLAWAAYEVYEKSKDAAFLQKCLPKLEAYIAWDIANRDENKNGLPEWAVEVFENCRSGESGLDNSPRFDDAAVLDAIDFSCYLANESKYLAQICRVLGLAERAAHWQQRFQTLNEAINRLLWCGEDGLYYDRKMDGTFSRVSAITSFLPLFAGVCDSAQAEKLAAHLRNAAEYFSAVPFPSVTLRSGKNDGDMWRGAVWLNMDYMVIRGLEDYGFTDLAAECRAKILAAVNEWYVRTGCIYEYYDPYNVCPPNKLKRKGDVGAEPDFRRHVHSISDYNWSAAFTLLFLICAR